MRFALAKVVEPKGGDGADVASAPLTGVGTVIGTAGHSRRSRRRKRELPTLFGYTRPVAGELVVIAGTDASVRDPIAVALHAEGYKVLSVPTEEAAVASLGQMKLVLPDLVLTELRGGGTPPVVDHLRASPLTQDVPVLLFANGSPDERRRALLLGISDLIQRPYDPEDVLLLVRLALERSRERRRSGEVLRGTLTMLPLAELLQALDAGRRTGVVELAGRGRTGTLWVRGGRVVDAETGDGRRGEDALFALFLWSEGTFSVVYGPISVAERITVSTTGLLLEAARRADEAERDQARPPFAAIPDQPPAPPLEVLAAHRALTILNIAGSYAASAAQPAFLAAALEDARRETTSEHPGLELFEVRSTGQVGFRDPGSPPVDAAAVVAATGAWLLRFFRRMDRAFPGRFEPRHLQHLTEAVREDLESLGFYSALGLPATGRKAAPEDSR